MTDSSFKKINICILSSLLIYYVTHTFEITQISTRRYVTFLVMRTKTKQADFWLGGSLSGWLSTANYNFLPTPRVRFKVHQEGRLTFALLCAGTDFELSKLFSPVIDYIEYIGLYRCMPIDTFTCLYFNFIFFPK